MWYTAWPSTQTGKLASDTYFWFDLITNNHHLATAIKPDDWWHSAFKENIRNIGNVLLIMMPWCDPISLTRIWCLFELHCAIDVGAQLYGVIPITSFEAVGAKYDAVMTKLAKLDVCSAQAREETDKAQI